MAEYEVGNSVDIIFPQNNPNLMKIMPKTMVSTSTGGGGGEGTNDHRQLTNRNATNQHPIGAISGLQSALDSKQSSEIEDVEGYFSIDTVEGALKELYDALHSLNIDSINGLRNEFGMIADAFEGMAEDINAKISCTDAQVGSYGYIKLSDLPIYDGGVV